MNYEILWKVGTLKPETILNILEVADFLGIGEFESATATWGSFSQTVIVTCISGQKYLFGLGSYGFVEIVRKDSTDGDIIFVPEE